MFNQNYSWLILNIQGLSIKPQSSGNSINQTMLFFNTKQGVPFVFPSVLIQIQKMRNIFYPVKKLIKKFIREKCTLNKFKYNLKRILLLGHACNRT